MSALVCWSGGLDSTAALLHAASESSHQVPIAAVSFNHRQIAASASERAARARILKWMRGQGYRVWHSEVFVKSKGALGLEPSATPDSDIAGMGRPSILHPFWVGMAFPYMRKDDDLVLGYIKWDSVWHRREWLHGAFRNLAAMNDITGRLLTPLEWWEKKDVVKNLRDWKFPLDLCWSCENPKARRPCGGCDPCTERRDAELGLARGVKKGGARV